MRKRKWEKRELVNAVLYLVKTGCQWRNLAHDFPPAFTVHSFYRRARLSGLWDDILAHLVKVSNAGKSEQCGFDMGKKNERNKKAGKSA